MDLRPVNLWTVSEVSTWLVSVDLSTLVPIFSAQEIDGYALLNLHTQDLDNLGLKIGQRKKLKVNLSVLKSQSKEKEIGVKKKKKTSHSKDKQIQKKPKKAEGKSESFWEESRRKTIL